MTVSFNIIHLPVVDSTQNEALARLRQGDFGPGGVVLADQQTQGRGRQNRVWETGPSGNLAATLVWPITNPGRTGDYSLIVAVALHSAVAGFLKDPLALRIKWPNDLMLHAKKCAGILLESLEPGWMFIGTGVNIMMAPSAHACLRQNLLTTITPRQLLDAYLNQFLQIEADYQTNGLSMICQKWMDRAYGLSSPMIVRTAREEFSGVFEGINDHGAAQIRLSDGQIRHIQAGEVFFR